MNKGGIGLRFEKKDSRNARLFIGQLKIEIDERLLKNESAGLIIDAQAVFMNAGSFYSNVPGRGTVSLEKPVSESEAILVKWDVLGTDPYAIMTDGQIVALDFEAKEMDREGNIFLKNASILVVLLPSQCIHAYHADFSSRMYIKYSNKGQPPEGRFGDPGSSFTQYVFEGYSGKQFE